MITMLPVLLPTLLAVAPQWQPDVRLTSNAAPSYTPFNFKSVAVSGSTVHAVWYDERDGNPEVYYKRSPDDGATWGPDTRLTNAAGFSWWSSVAVSGSQVHVVWMDDRDGNFEIYTKRSLDGGVTWSPDVRLTNEAATSRFPSVAASGSIVNVTWQDTRDGNAEIYTKRSTDGGASWGADVRLTVASADSIFASVASAGLTVVVTWEEYRDGNPEIYAKCSANGGATWSADARLTNDPAISFSPNVWVTGTDAHVVWYDTRHVNNELFYKRSTTSGATWGPDTRLTTNPGGSVHPSITTYGTHVHMVWNDDRDGNNEVYYLHSADRGITWGAATRLTVNSAASVGMSVAVSGGAVHVVWNDRRDGNREIYYKKMIHLTPSLQAYGAPCTSLLFGGVLVPASGGAHVANLQVSGAVPNTIGILVAGNTQLAMPLPPPWANCSLLASPDATAVFLVDSGGGAQLTLTVPAAPGLVAFLQCVTLDVSWQLDASNGLRVDSGY